MYLLLDVYYKILKCNEFLFAFNMPINLHINGCNIQLYTTVEHCII